MMDNEDNAGWAWWAGREEEIMRFGPCATREIAIEEARQDGCCEFLDYDGIWKVGVHIVEALNNPLRLADFVPSPSILEMADDDLAESDRSSAEFDDGPWFKATADQERDLTARIERACDEWQEAHGLVFTCQTFSETRNQEFVVVPHPLDDVAPDDIASGEIE